jgi:hypothetical protein
MEEIKHFLQELGAGGGGGGEDEEYDSEDYGIVASLIGSSGLVPQKSRDPMYESWGTCIDKKWPLRLPPNRPRGFATATPDFVRLLKSLNFFPRDPAVGEALVELSREFNRLRTALKEQSRRCDHDTYFTYLILLKKLWRFFENSDCSFDTYFAQRCIHSQSSHFMYEYMQALLMTVARIFEQASARDQQPDAKCADDFLMCQYLFDELCRSVEYCQSERLMQSGKWIYQPPVTGIGSSDKQLQRLQSASYQALVSRERALIQGFIRDDLHGLESLQLRSLLCRIKMTEVAISIVQSHVPTLADASQRCERVYNKLAPLMLCCKQHYDTIVSRLKNTDPTPSLLPYAQFHSYHWYLREELALAQAEWDCFNMEGFEQFDTYGKRAIRRLCVLQQSTREKESWLRSLGPGNELLREWDTIKRQIVQMHDEVRSKAVSTLWNGASGISIPVIQVYKAPEDRRNLFSVYTVKWEHISQQNPSLVTAFDFLEQLVSQSPETVLQEQRPQQRPIPAETGPASSSISIQQRVSPLIHNNHTDIALENQRIAGLTEERVNTLEWLVDMIDDDGTLYIDEVGCAELRYRLAETLRYIAENGITFPPQK